MGKLVGIQLVVVIRVCWLARPHPTSVGRTLYVHVDVDKYVCTYVRTYVHWYICTL